MEQPRDVELVFSAEEEGGFHVYAPDLPGLYTQRDTQEDAVAGPPSARVACCSWTAKREAIANPRALVSLRARQARCGRRPVLLHSLEGREVWSAGGG
jgi:hypothetical protein